MLVTLVGVNDGSQCLQTRVGTQSKADGTSTRGGRAYHGALGALRGCFGVRACVTEEEPHHDGLPAMKPSTHGARIAPLWAGR